MLRIVQPCVLRALKTLVDLAVLELQYQERVAYERVMMGYTKDPAVHDLSINVPVTIKATGQEPLRLSACLGRSTMFKREIPISGGETLVIPGKIQTSTREEFLNLVNFWNAA